MYDNNSEWTQVGEIGVDAGLCWIGDPCYVVSKDASNVFESWDTFLETLWEGLDRDQMNAQKHKQFNYGHGHAGLGVAVSTGYGDGTYPVYIKTNSEGRVVCAMVDFDDTAIVKDNCEECGEEFPEDDLSWNSLCDSCESDREREADKEDEDEA